MPETRFTELFKGLFGGENADIKVFETAVITGFKLDCDTRVMEISINTNSYISAFQLANVKGELKKAFKLEKIIININYSAACFCKQACIDAVESIKAENCVVNGFFDDAEITVDNDSVNFKLFYGGEEKLKQIDFEGMFKKAVKNKFSKDINLTLDITDLKQNKEQKLKETQNVLTKAETPAVKESSNPQNPSKKKNKKSYIFPTGGIKVDADSVKLLMGNHLPNNNILAMSEIIPPENPGEALALTLYGEVLDFEKKEVSTRYGKRLSCKFVLSDHTNSVICKLWIPTDKKEVLSGLKNKSIIICDGKYEYDYFYKEFCFTPENIATAKTIVETDGYDGQKRVELHCHTNMSAKDAVSSAEDIIMYAYKLGHKAVAITDHGVVQAYPSAYSGYKAVKKAGGKIKVIYGVEDYFIDDTGEVKNKTKLERNHQIILVRNKTGLKNLYELVSKAHIDDFYKKPLTRRSEIEKHREGLIIGSACEAGDLYKAIVRGAPHDELIRIASFYDYLEIQPVGNNMFMVRDSSKPDKIDKKTGAIIPNVFKNVTSEEVIKDFNRKVVEIADELGKPVVATGDVHFLRKEDGIIRKIILAANGYEDFDNQAPLYLKTTTEMLKDFEYFGDRAKEFVIDNPNKIADLIDDDITPIPEGNYPPVIEGSDELLREICWNKAHSMYGQNLPEIVEKRLSKELDGIINNGYSIMYISAQKLVSYSEEHGYLVGSRGSVGSSFVATMAGISEVNPLPPHYYCPNCKNSEFENLGDYGSGFDLPEKKCPKCGTMYKRDGHNIPFETFLGFDGNKVPDIDLNFSDEIQNEVQKYTEEMFGSENVFKAGTISTIAEKTAFGYVKAYCELKNITLSNAELNRLALAVKDAKVKTTTGQHPAGMVIVPQGKSIFDFCPIQHPADDVNSNIQTTHFDFKSIHDTILKLDELGHVVPTTYKYLEEYSGIKVNEISMSDPDVYSLFKSPEILGVTEDDIFSKTGTYGLPEFGTPFVREMLLDCKPTCFADLLQISGLSHGEDVWLGNAKDLIDKGVCNISNVIGTRDNIMVYLIKMGMNEGRAFSITETVRKGNVAKGKISMADWGKMEDDMRDCNVPDWYIQSCKKIKYMFPKAHAAAYVISALRLAWYKVHKPLEFYCAYFTARPEDIDAPTLIKGPNAVKNMITAIRSKGKEATAKEMAVLDNLYIFNEMLSRGIEILPIDLKKSHAVKYVPEDGKMRLPFGAISGMGDKAAYAVYKTAQKGNYVSRDDFQIESGVSKAIIQSLCDIGAMSNLPESNQTQMVF